MYNNLWASQQYMGKTIKVKKSSFFEDSSTKKETLKTVLNRLMDENHLSVSELSKLVNLPASTISRMKCEDDINPTISTLIPIANYFDIKIEQLLGTERLPQDRKKGEFNPNQAYTIQIPIVTTNMLLETNGKKSQFSCKKSLPHIFVSNNINEKSFAIILPDSSLRPMFNPETILVFDPEQMVKDGDIVIVSFDKKTPVFRRVFCDGENYFFDPVNKELGEMMVSGDFVIYGVMVIAIIETRENLMVEIKND